jgi:asparagine synthase (glutamine-hydrolysing)
MCGIAGGIHQTPSLPERRQVLDRLRHRGPDDSGYFEDEGIWLMNARLAIQDLSYGGHQPMRTEDGNYTIVYNGELYNASVLRLRLEQEGISFKSRCDTEVLLQAFANWGASCLDELEGDFAFAVWNKVRKELFIARDPMGVKPMYVYDDGKKILFASELKALIGLSGLDYELNIEALRDYLLYLYSPSEATPFRHVRKLMPGHCMRVVMGENERNVPKQYDTLVFKQHTGISVEEWERKLEQTLSGVVERQLISDAPVGMMLSGGLDSSLIAALAKKVEPDLKIQAFTIHTNGMLADEGFEDDVRYANDVAKQLGIPLTEVAGDLVPSQSMIDELVWNLDEPQADPAAWYAANITAVAHEAGIKVLLSGTGADDVFSGYRRHAAARYYGLMRFVPNGTEKLISSLQGLLPRQHSGLRRVSKIFGASALSAQRAAIHSHFWIAPEQVDLLFNDKKTGASYSPYSLFEDLLSEIPEEEGLLQQMLFWEQRTFLPHHNLAYMDKMGMAHSVEVRVPYVDREIVRLAGKMPVEIKMKGKTSKYVLREVAKDYLTTDVIDRSKTGFGAPLRQWINGQMSGLLRERLLDHSFLSRGIFSRADIEKLIRENEERKIDGAYTLFSLLCIESWLRQFAPTT